MCHARRTRVGSCERRWGGPSCRSRSKRCVETKRDSVSTQLVAIPLLTRRSSGSQSFAVPAAASPRRRWDDHAVNAGGVRVQLELRAKLMPAGGTPPTKRVWWLAFPVALPSLLLLVGLGHAVAYGAKLEIVAWALCAASAPAFAAKVLGVRFRDDGIEHLGLLGWRFVPWRSVDGLVRQNTQAWSFDFLTLWLGRRRLVVNLDQFQDRNTLCAWIHERMMATNPRYREAMTSAEGNSTDPT